MKIHPVLVKKIGSIGGAFVLSLVLFVLKVGAFLATHSTAVLADVCESALHLIITAFAAFSLLLAKKPADRDHLYGHDRIAFFSAGVEGTLILVAAAAIFIHLIQAPRALTNLDVGITLFALSFLLNGAMGIALIRQSRSTKNLILEAHGRHLLTDCITSGGVLVALVLVGITGKIVFDPLIAVVVALNIIWTGLRLVCKAVDGLMDRADSKVDFCLRDFLDREEGVDYHRLRHRMMGNRLEVDVHLLFPQHLSLVEAHARATKIEKGVLEMFDHPVDFTSHLEPRDDHDAFHARIFGHKRKF